jgi:predicted DNA-binding ribbon-helix-helix protein
VTAIEKHSVLLDGHKTSVSLEREFWDALAEIAQVRGCSLNALVAEIDRARAGNLSSALRLYVLRRYRARSGKAPAIPEAPS